MLDPEARALLNLLAERGVPPTHMLTPEEARRVYRERRFYTQPDPPQLAEVRDLTADTSAGAVPLRLYRPAGLPARAVLTPWLSRYLSSEARLQRRAKVRECLEGFDCLQSCGLRDGIARIGQFCIDLKLAQAVRGDVERGLFFRGKGALPFGEARDTQDSTASERSP